MPQLEEGLWIEGGYYVDFDELDQFRIIGPNNELYCGLIDIPRHKIRISRVTSPTPSQLEVSGAFTVNSINVYYPTMDDVRSIREILSHPHGHKLTFLELRREHPAESTPMYVRHSTKHNKKFLVFRRNYGDFWYQTEWELPEHVSMREINHPYKGFRLSVRRGNAIPFVIRADTNDKAETLPSCRLMPSDALNWSIFGKQKKALREFWDRSAIEITHLLTWKKTSGDRFGTIFPRDWMESILLGSGDIQQETIDYMFVSCLEHVDAKGHGWHEDVVGEYRYEHELAGKEIFDRKMIDTEPMYLLCIPHLSPAFWKNSKAVAKLQRVAKYVLTKASQKKLITFKKLPLKHRTPNNEYYWVGDWRDSSWAYKHIHQVLAPYSVNAALYPQALLILKSYAKQLKVNERVVSQAAKRWSQTAEMFRYHDEKGKEGFALALYDIAKKKTITYKKMRVRHLDEAYRFALGICSEHDAALFAHACLSPEIFYTPSGPTIIEQHNAYGFTTLEYHGLVIWAKQAAFTVMALSRLRECSVKQSWKKTTKEVIENAIRATCTAVLQAFLSLRAIPELHYDKDGIAHFYTDQMSIRGEMSKVQLWSAVGFRRIIREYHDFLEQTHQKSA